MKCEACAAKDQTIAGWLIYYDEKEAEIARLRLSYQEMCDCAGEWETEAGCLRAALEGLVNRLDYVHNDPAYKSVWTVNQIHVGPYNGPTYTADLEKARHELANEQLAPYTPTGSSGFPPRGTGGR